MHQREARGSSSADMIGIEQRFQRIEEAVIWTASGSEHVLQSGMQHRAGLPAHAPREQLDPLASATDSCRRSTSLPAVRGYVHLGDEPSLFTSASALQAGGHCPVAETDNVCFILFSCALV
jgi:hypothetical protein